MKKISSIIKDYELKQKDKNIDRYTRMKYEYLVEKLNKTKNEICEYLIEGINLHVYKEVMSLDTSYFYANDVYRKQKSNRPYSFRNNEEDYLMSVFDGLNFKFKSMPLKERLELKQLYVEDEQKFYMLLDNYITNYKISDKILCFIEENHFLSKRVMLKQAIENFKEDRFEIFCQIVPLQIEGIIYDYCIELNVPHNQLERLTLDQKVDLIVEKDRSFKGHEYFKYDFIELRNTAAHGRLHTNLDYQNTANMLLLDLLYLCEFVNKSSATAVNMMKIIFQLFEKSRMPVLKDLLILELFSSYKIEEFPSFYQKEATIAEFEKYAHSDGFLSFLRTMLLDPSYLKEDEEKYKKIEKVIIYIKKSKECEEEGKRLLRRLSEINKNS
ncbi:hypothetical protein [Bacillus cereus]|uniref:hypothetical protein n=1 Tax=Bacillus cereus TaxID=1396 RepID=UPI0037FEB87E